MNRRDLEVAEGRQYVGENETVIWTVTTTPWGSTPSSPVITVEDLSNNEADVTTTITGDAAASVSGDVITLPACSGWTRGHVYRIRVQFTTGSNTLEVKAIVDVDP